MRTLSQDNKELLKGSTLAMLQMMGVYSAILYVLRCALEERVDREQQASPAGWCIMMRALGMAKRLPLAPAASSTVAVLAQSPSAIVHTSGLIASIVSRSAMTE